MIEYDSTPFGQGPVQHLDWLLTLRRLARASVLRCAAVAFLLSWPPLVLLAAGQGLATGGEPHEALLLDFLATARYAIAVPLFVIAESIYVPQLCRIYREFADGGFVADEDHERFAELGIGTGHVLGSLWMEVALVALAYGITFGARDVYDVTAISSWAEPVRDGLRQKSWAGWWRLFVSHPLFLVLLLRSLVRLCAWTWVLWRISRMHLRLVPAHADLVGGLLFVTTSVYALLPLAFTFGVLMAARATEGVIVDGLSPLTFQQRIIATPVVALVAFAGPLLVFEPHLWQLKAQGLFDYGVLATRVGRCFEARWLTGGTQVTESALEAPDFSATTDLFSIVSNVRQSRLILIDWTVVVQLVVTVLLPFIPLLFALVSVRDVLTFVWKAVV